MKIKPIFLILALVVLAGFLLINQSIKSFGPSSADEEVAVVEPVINDRLMQIEITPNATYGVLMEQAGISNSTSSAILTASKEVYDLAKIRVDRTLDLYFEPETDNFKQLVYQIDSEEELFVTLTEGQWLAERKPIDYEIKVKNVEGELETSLYEWALASDVDIRAIIELADAYQWTIDFAMDPRIGDTFKFIYEERYRGGEYKMPGQVLAGKYVNQGEEHYVYYFEETEENKGFFDPDGNSVQKMFLKAPIQYKYITSGYTTGLRCLESYGLCTGHRAIDYAAPIGTPIRAVGDGTVTYAGLSSVGYGNLTSIRHNGTYSTNYAHQSRIIVRYGQKVKQGEIIGYVGSTGLSTGPHLHYEMVKHGVKINPLAEVLPPGEPIKEENKVRFFEVIKKYQEILEG